MSRHIPKIILLLCFSALLVVAGIIAKRHFYPNTIGEFLGMSLRNPDSINVVYGNSGDSITVPSSDKKSFISDLYSIHIKRLEPNDYVGYTLFINVKKGDSFEQVTFYDESLCEMNGIIYSIPESERTKTLKLLKQVGYEK